MGANIFISFASQDLKVAMTLCSALENRGFRCWISARDILPGENFQVAIVRAIRQAKIMLLVFTANSNNSEEMNKELALASQNKLIVVPLRIEDVAPNDAFSYEFATRQWIDFFADWEFAIQQLAERIGNATQEDAPPARPGPKPVARQEAVEIPAAPLQIAPRPSAEFTLAVDDDEDAGVDADDVAAVEFDVGDPIPGGVAQSTPPRRGRVALYAAASLLLLLGAGLAFALPGLLRSKSEVAQPRLMEAVRHAGAPPDLRRTSVDTTAAPVVATPLAAAGPSETESERPVVEKPAPRKKKSQQVAHAADNYVPY